jgi:hypothetical protein
VARQWDQLKVKGHHFMFGEEIQPYNCGSCGEQVNGK